MMRVDVLLRRTRDYGDEQDRFGSSPSSNRTEKVPPGRLWCSTLQAKPAHNKTLCTDSNGKQASKTSTAEAFPLPPFCYALPVLLFLAFCIARTGRKKNRIHITEKHNKKAREKKREQSKKQQNTMQAKKQQRKQASKSKKSRSGYYIKIPNKQKEKQAITNKQDKEKSKRNPRKAYKHTSKEGKGKAILFPPMPIYRIAIYYNKAI